MNIYGVQLNDRNNLFSELLKIYGIGKRRSFVICFKFNLFNKIVGSLTSKEISLVTCFLGSYLLESDLKIVVKNNIARLLRIRCYRGIRHLLRLPVRGQRTRTNSRTARKILFNYEKL